MFRQLIFLLTFVPFIYSEQVTVIPCTRGDFGTATVHQVRITPCPEASKRRPCILRKGTDVGIEVDFTPTVTADKIIGRAFWASRMMELPMPGMNTNACESLNCPMQAGVNQTYRYSLPVSRSFPNRRYDVKWRLNSGDYNMCFQFPIQIVN